MTKNIYKSWIYAMLLSLSVSHSAVHADTHVNDTGQTMTIPSISRTIRLLQQDSISILNTTFALDMVICPAIKCKIMSLVCSHFVSEILTFFYCLLLACTIYLPVTLSFMYMVDVYTSGGQFIQCGREWMYQFSSLI